MSFGAGTPMMDVCSSLFRPPIDRSSDGLTNGARGCATQVSSAELGSIHTGKIVVWTFLKIYLKVLWVTPSEKIVNQRPVSCFKNF